MKYIIERTTTIGKRDYKEPIEQYNAFGYAIYAYELYKWAYKDFACTECSVTQDKIVFTARKKTTTVTITFEVVA